MSTRDILAQQIGMIYGIIERNVEGVSHDDSLAPAAGGGNTANWILGHLVNVHNALMRLVGAPPVWEDAQLDRARFDHPIRSAAEAIDWDTLVARFAASRDHCLAAIAAQSDDTLADKVIDPFGTQRTRAELIALLVIHQCYHAGQLGMARRAAGRKAAILAPGQTAPI
jgi:uncharacterized damage-inducible protein DinB